MKHTITMIILCLIFVVGCTTGPTGFRINGTDEVMVLYGIQFDDENLIWSEAKRVCGKRTPELVERNVANALTDKFICK